MREPIAIRVRRGHLSEAGKYGFLPGTVFCLLLTMYATAQAQSGAVEHPARRGAVIGGVVRDQLEALVSQARVSLLDDRGHQQSLETDPAGRFAFSGLSAGKYRLRVEKPGFTVFEKIVDSTGLRIDLPVVLALAPLEETVNVTGQAQAATFDLDSGAGTLLLTAKDLQALPDDPDRFRERLQDLATSAGGAPGQAVVTVDGFLEAGRLPPKSSIQEVRVLLASYSSTTTPRLWMPARHFLLPSRSMTRGVMA